MPQIHHIIPQELYRDYFPHLTHMECHQPWNLISLNCHNGAHGTYTRRIAYELANQGQYGVSNMEFANRVRRFLLARDTHVGHSPGLDAVYLIYMAEFNQYIAVASGAPVPDDGKRHAAMPKWLTDF